MRIISLHAENVKRLKAVDITPTDNTIVIAGRNGMGKSSILDAILLALAGKDAAKLMTRPIRDGQEEASVELDIGDFKIRRNWTANDKSYLTMRSKDGEKVASPQALLDTIVGNLSLDPLSFSRQSPKAQRETLLSLVDIGFSLDDWQKNYDEVFAERTQVGRDLAQVEGQLAGLPQPEEGMPEEEVSIAELLQKTEKAKETYRRSNELVNAINAHQAAIDRLRQQIEISERLIAADQAELETYPDRGEQAHDIEALSGKLATAEETNRKVRGRKEREAVAQKADRVRAKQAELTERLEKGRAMKDEALSRAKMPIEGLSVDEAGITYRGIPFGQLSAAEQLKVSLAIAMAMNPTLKVIRILDGSLLDDDSMRVVREMVQEKDWQCWIETCHAPGDGSAIIIEDGEVVPSSR